MKKKAIWWFYPALLEPCDGPWGCVADYGHDPVHAWQAIIDWAAALNVTHLIPGIEPYLTDRVTNQWGFHYVCRFPDDPAARCFDDDTIERNIDVVRRIAAYGRQQDVAILFHHYNLIAPEAWVRARPELAAKYDAVRDPVWGRGFHNDRMGFLVSNVCWNDPEYRAFLTRCWHEVFTNIPELAGAMITAGEFMFCGCNACTGGAPAHIFQGGEKVQDEQAAAQRELRTRKRGEMIVDLIRLFSDTLSELDKQAIVRNWVVERWLDQMPPGVHYATKYSVFDACRGGPDPVVHQWLDAGHRMWETLAIEAENSGPILWHDETWCRSTAERINSLDLEGCIVHLNTQWGHTGHIASFTASRNVTRVLEHLASPAPPGDSRTEFAGFFGPDAGPVIADAVELLARFPMHMTEAIHLNKEGYSYGMPPWFDGHWRWPGALGSPRYQAPDWINIDGLSGIHDLLQIVRAEPEEYARLIERPEGTAISRCDEIAGWCTEALALLDTCPTPPSAAGQSEVRALIASAHIGHLAATEHACVLRARVAWEALKAGDANARTSAVNWYARAIDALHRQLPWGLELARIYRDVAHHVIESHQTFNRLTLATRLRIRRAELELIRSVEGPDWEDQMTITFWPFLPESIGRREEASGIPS